MSVGLIDRAINRLCRTETRLMMQRFTLMNVGRAKTHRIISMFSLDIRHLLIEILDFLLAQQSLPDERERGECLIKLRNVEPRVIDSRRVEDQEEFFLAKFITLMTRVLFIKFSRFARSVEKVICSD